MSDRLLTTREVADRLGLSSATVLRRWRAGQIPGFRIDTNVLRFDGQEIDDWLDARHQNALRSDDSPGIQERDARPGGTFLRSAPPGQTEGE